MKCVSGLSIQDDSRLAFEEIRGKLSSGLDGSIGDFALLFVTPPFAEQLAGFARQLLDAGLVRHTIGCTAESIVGEDREIEGAPALSAFVASGLGGQVHPFRIGRDEPFIPSPCEAKDRCASFLLADPFTFPADPWLKRFHEDVPGVPIFGGMASGSRSPGSNRLVLDRDVHDFGAVGLHVMTGEGVAIRDMVSQGCRPIGRPMIVTRCERNVIYELGRRSSLEVLREQFEELGAEDQQRAQNGLHIGRVINEYQDSFGRGDFLVRNVLGADQEGGIAITDLVRVGQTLQFHVRDAETADEDLATLLVEERMNHPRDRPIGALLFTCNGRGSRLFQEAHHDVRKLQKYLGEIPVAGFFAMGEIGPIGGQNFVHGYTASVAIFERIDGTPA